MKKLLMILFAAALCLAPASCGGGASSSVPAAGPSGGEPDEAAPKLLIAALFPEQNDVTAQVVSGCQAAADEAGVSVSFDFSYGGREAERALLGSLSPSRCDGLLVWPSDAEVSFAELSRVSGRGVPVALVGDAPRQNDFAVSAGAVDDYALGKAAGAEAKAYVADKLSGKASVAILEPAEKSEAATLRVNGFLDQLKELEGVKLVKDFKARDAEAMSGLLDSYLSVSRDSAATVYFSADASLTAALNAALVKAEMKDKAVIYAAGCDAPLAQLLEAGDSAVRAVAAADYHRIGYDAASALLAAIESGDHSASGGSAAQPILLTPSNLNDHRDYLDSLAGPAEPAEASGTVS